MDVSSDAGCSLIAGFGVWQWPEMLWGYKRAPSFFLQSSTGRPVSLEDFRGKKEVVLVFYMGAGLRDVPRAAREAASARRKNRGRGCCGACTEHDTAEEASKLARDLNLAFPVLSDPNMGIVREYGMYGRQMKTPEMVYTVIDKEGRIRTEEVDREFVDHAL